MEQIQKLVEDLLLEKVKECREEIPQPALYVLLQSDCTVELSPEVLIPLKVRIEMG